MEPIDTFKGHLISRKRSNEEIKSLNWYLTIQEITVGLGFLDYLALAYLSDGQIPHFSESEDGLRSHLLLMEKRVEQRSLSG